MLVPTDNVITDDELGLIINRPLGLNTFFEVDCGEFRREQDGKWRLFIFKNDEMSSSVVVMHDAMREIADRLRQQAIRKTPAPSADKARALAILLEHAITLEERLERFERRLVRGDQ